MESRYALREIEGAIGYDCRTLEDGRRASFRHTLFHRKARRDFFERRDLVMVMQSTYLAMASLSANMRVDLDAARSIAASNRRALVRAAFPYMPEEKSEIIDKDTGYDEYFDELDEIIAKEKEAQEGPEDVGADGPK